MAASKTGLDRLLRPRTIAVVGGGAWCRNVIKTSLDIGFKGQIWPVHPKASEIEGLQAYPSIDALPAPPDASFLGINRHATIECLSALSKRGAGGAVCFASGFAEASGELADGADLQTQLLEASGDMSLLGPNCYGVLNYLDGTALWPDQHGGVRVQSGAAIITQSSNIAINLTMQNRGLPIAYVVTAGNQAKTDLAEIGLELLSDPRVTCLGLHIEGINDIRALERLSNASRKLGKPICALKIGRSGQAQLASVSHTASLAGSHAGASALLARLAIAQPNDLATFLELLKIWHVAGPLRLNAVASASCSGGEASLMADLGQAKEVNFPALSQRQTQALQSTLGTKVALANPLDYHTYIWPDRKAMGDTFSALFNADLGLGIVVLDFPRLDRCSVADWDHALAAILDAAHAVPVPVAVLSSLPDTMPEAVSTRLIENGVIPLCGMDHALGAVTLAVARQQTREPVLLPKVPRAVHTLTESTAKDALSAAGLHTPKSRQSKTPKEAAQSTAKLTAPFVLKGLGLAHKTEAGAVRLNLQSAEEVLSAAQTISAEGFLVEEMIQSGVVELLLAVTLDPAHGYILTLGAGGTQTELLQDSFSLVLPVSQSAVSDALRTLRCAPLLDGYRRASPIDRGALWRAIDAVQNYVIAHHGQIQEVEINPLICTPSAAIAVDALIVQGERV